MNDITQDKKQSVRNPWSWVPSLYFAEGIPYVIVMTVSVIMYKRLGISNTDIALYTSWLYLPWVIKPLWSPIVDLVKTKRFWIISMQFLIGVSFACVAFTIPTSNFFQITLAFLWLMAFSSATHDIGADGFYMIGLNQGQQSFFVGIRSTFYRIAMITGQGLLVILAGQLETHYGDLFQAWKITFLVLSAMMILFALYHSFVVPKSFEQEKVGNRANFLGEFMEIIVSFFKKKNIGIALAFLLLYRMGEAQLVKMAAPFLLDEVEKGGLGLSTSAVGTIYGTIGIIALSIGGILGGWLVARKGLKYWMWWMIAAINIPNLLYVALAAFQPESFAIIGTAIAVEQFGYGFGFTAYLMFMIYVAEGQSKTAHYALTTGFMALGMMLPGMASGWIQETVGYELFFTWAVLSAIPGFVVIKFLNVPAEFGRVESKIA